MDEGKVRRLEGLLGDEDFMINLLSRNTVEDVKALFLEEDIEVSDDEVKSLGNMLIKLVSRGGKLTEEDLAEISGGRNLRYDSKDEHRILFNTRVCNCINTDVIKNGGNKLILGNWIKSDEHNM